MNNFGHNEFDRFNKQFDDDWNKAKKGFGAFAVFAILVNLAWMAVVVWAIVQLVQWVVAK